MGRDMGRKFKREKRYTHTHTHTHTRTHTPFMLRLNRKTTKFYKAIIL